VKATWGKITSPDLCRFYDEFGKNVKQASIRTGTKQPILSSKKLPEGVIESNLSSPSLPLSSSLPLAATPKKSLPSLPRGKVIWVYVNLRVGPGIQYKIIGKAYMKNTFEILAESPGWLRVRLENRTVGWMSKKATSESSHTSSPESPPTLSHDSSKTKFSTKQYDPM